jgi:hypothetical protein
MCGDGSTIPLPQYYCIVHAAALQKGIARWYGELQVYAYHIVHLPHRHSTIRTRYHHGGPRPGVNNH